MTLFIDSTTEGVVAPAAFDTVPNKTSMRWWSRVASGVANAWRAHRAEQIVQQRIRDLHALDSHLLADIGIPRNEIEHAVRNGMPDGPLFR